MSVPAALEPACDAPGVAWRGAQGALLLAACALPGVWPAGAAAQAETEAPPQLSFRTLHYQDRQPGLKRVKVTAPALAVQWPVAARWSLAGVATTDAVSGATPRYHSSVSGASRMHDERRGGELRLTRHEDRGGFTLGGAFSDENDYHSRALSVTGRWSTADNNRSWSAGLAATHDRIGSSDDADLHERRRTREYTVGLTQVISPRAIAQLTLTHAAGHGFYSDPYKRLDQRPRTRHQSTLVLRWNQHLEGLRSTLRLNGRAYRDSFGVRAHTLAGEWVWNLNDSLTLTPLLRLHTQNAARFYGDPVYSFVGEPYPPGYLEAPPAYLSLDHRLSAFGAVTAGARLGWRLPQAWAPGWSAELRWERYEQRARWRVGGPGSPGLAPLSARLLQWGVTRRF